MPRVCRIAGAPSWSIPVNTCGTAAALIASTAVPIEPSGRFFIPIGIDRPDDSWRCTWLSTVRAPIAPHPTVSAMYCGVIGSRNSQPTGRPSSSTCRSSCRAVRRPRFTSPEPSRPGSLIRPFQPRVERGFSKYTRITTSRPSESRSATGRRRSAYSRAAFASCTEHGPTTTSRRSSTPFSTSVTAWRPSTTVRARASLSGQFVVQGERRDQRDGLLDPSVDDRGLFALFRQGVHGTGTFPPDGRGWSQAAG